MSDPSACGKKPAFRSTESPMSEQRRGIDYLEKSTAHGRFVGHLQRAVLLICVLSVLGSYLKPQVDPFRLLGVAGFAAAILASRWVLRYGPEAAIKFLSLALWLINSLFVYKYAGVYSANLHIYPFLIALAGWILGIRWLFGMTAATVSFLLGIGLADYWGLYQPTPRADPILAALVPIGVLLAGAYMVYSIFSNFANSRDRLLATGNQLAESNAELLEKNAALMESRAQVEHITNHDPITNLPNRQLLTDRLQRALTASTRSGKQVALLFIDLDDFKTVNDTLGHDIGDLLLRQVAKRLKDCVREGDTVARFGGDEFVVVLEDLNGAVYEAATHAESIGEKILAALNQPYDLAGHPCLSTPSIGIALFADPEASADDLMKRADVAMYQAKAAGRNTLRFFDPEMQAAVAARIILETDLREGIKQEQLLLYYQPQVDATGCVAGAEALVRWRHPRRGLVSPADFIPLAEETGLILPLGSWVLTTACRQLVAWACDPATAGLTLAVNVSARQFRQPDFVKQVRGILESSGANPRQLKLELTESLLLEDVEDIIAKMNALKVSGISFSLDDFGTGYSSLSYLKRLPLDQLKIDQGFVRDILVDPNDAAIAKMVIALAGSLGLTVIAEGVETEAQRDFLSRHGCTAYQGYLFSRPVPLDEFEAFLQRA